MLLGAFVLATSLHRIPHQPQARKAHERALLSLHGMLPVGQFIQPLAVGLLWQKWSRKALAILPPTDGKLAMGAHTQASKSNVCEGPLKAKPGGGLADAQPPLHSLFLQLLHTKRTVAKGPLRPTPNLDAEAFLIPRRRRHPQDR